MMLRIIKLIGLTALITAVSCGVSERSLDNAQKRIDELKAAGVPDSALSGAKVYLYQAKDARQRGNTGLAKQADDSLKFYIAAAEAMHKDNLSRLMPVIDSLRSVIRSSRSGLTGLQLKKIDSMMVPVDSFIAINWYLQAFIKAQEITGSLQQLTLNEQRAVELKKKVPGKWVCTNITKSTENRAIRAVEKKTFTFSRDGKVALVEKKSGQSGPYLKEDWEFNSWGTYDFLGDTIHLFINRFASVKQNFERIHVENGKKIWKKEPAETYDSLITDGSQDRYITYGDLAEDFVRGK